jgi:biopolymer transport protein ExbB
MMVFFEKGGPLMWPLLICSLVSLTVTIERVLFWLRLRRGRNGGAVDEMFRRTEQGDFGDAGTSGHLDYVGRVLAAGLAHRDHGLSEALQVAAQDEIARMRSGLGVLDTIVTLAPLLGILGTVLGIIESFDVLAEAGIGDPKAVTGGIAKALITTATGLSVAIVSLIPYNSLVGAVQRATGRLEGAATRFEVAYRKGLEKRDAAQ